MNYVLTSNDMKTRRREMMNHHTKMLHRGKFLFSCTRSNIFEPSSFLHSFSYSLCEILLVSVYNV